MRMSWLAACLAGGLLLNAQSSPLGDSVQAAAPDAVRFLEKIVNINSGTFNPPGVQAVAAVMESEFRALGFETRQFSGVALQRGPHLYAEHKGSRPAKPLLLIGHMDYRVRTSEPLPALRAQERNDSLRTRRR